MVLTISPKASAKKMRFPARFPTVPQSCFELACCNFARLHVNSDGSARGSRRFRIYQAMVSYASTSDGIQIGLCPGKAYTNKMVRKPTYHFASKYRLVGRTAIHTWMEVSTDLI